MLKNILIAMSLLLITACGSTYNATTQVAEQAYLQLTGNFWNAQVSVDNQAAVAIMKDNVESFEIGNKEVVRFPVSPGTHLITVSKNGTVIVKRKIYVSNSNTFEVIVP
ncbi:MAG: hypothetical protein ACPGUD_06915 [Parashewanella sp.]